MSALSAQSELSEVDPNPSPSTTYTYSYTYAYAKTPNLPSSS